MGNGASSDTLSFELISGEEADWSAVNSWDGNYAA